MVTAAKSHAVGWMAPSPLWSKAIADKDERRTRLQQPAVLRFNTDAFMEQLAEVLAAREPDLADLVAQPETWDEEAVGWVTGLSLFRAQIGQMKLYQPAQGRFYLVAATLACRLPGLPDHRINLRAKERAFYVLRRLVKAQGASRLDPANAATWAEYGWVPGAKNGAWMPVPKQDVLENEERLPLFPLNFKDGEQPRRLLAGFIPVASRETYQAAAESSPIAPAVPGVDPGETEDPRETQLTNRLQIPLDQLKEKGDDTQSLEVSTFILLDFALWLEENVADVWAAVADPPSTSPRFTPQKQALYDLLGEKIESGGSTTWAEALRQAYGRQSDILQGTVLSYNLKPTARDGTAMSGEALPALVQPWSQVAPSQPVDPPTIPKLHPADYYVIRCVYDRPACEDCCPPTVSDPTVPFQFASFFDPQAPARDIRIVMPSDVSIAGLRRFKKSVSIMVSEKLRNQMERFRGVDFNMNLKSPGGFNLGMMCTLSIPIITICALILLLIIVQLLNIVFWWVPYLKVCFPVKRQG